MPWAEKKSDKRKKSRRQEEEEFYSTSQQERLDDLFQKGGEAFSEKHGGREDNFTRTGRKVRIGALVISVILFVGYLIATSEDENASQQSSGETKSVVDSSPTPAAPTVKRGYCVDSTEVTFITEVECGNRPWFRKQARANEEYRRLKSPALVTAKDNAGIQQENAALPLPPNGTIRSFAQGDRPALLKVKASGRYNYLVKMTKPNSTDTVMDLIVHADQKAEMKVPLGTFEIKWAAGQKWYGYERGKRYGPSTKFNKANQVFMFEQTVTKTSTERLTSTTVLEITLFEVVSGNMPSREIPENQF
jgi:hypothetical protein